MRKDMLAMVLSSVSLACAGVGDDGLGMSSDEIKASAKAEATIVDQTGTNIGAVKLEQKGDTVVGKVEIYVATPGFHGFHLHGIGSCTATFTSAGGHYNPGGATHGSHAGDLPSILIKSDGSGEMKFETDRFTIDEIFDADGAAFVLHAGADNFANIPTRYFSTTENVSGADSSTLGAGDAGSRAGCGVAVRTQ